MRPLKAQVRNGRLTLDEPTDLPDGEVVYLQSIDEIIQLTDDDDLDEAERAELHRDLDASLAEAEAGETVDLAEALAELRRR